MALATHLKFHPNTVRLMPGEVSVSTATEYLVAANKPAPALAVLAVGTPVVVLHNGALVSGRIKAVQAAAAAAAAAPAPALRAGMRLEAKDRKNPNMICQ